MQRMLLLFIIDVLSMNVAHFELLRIDLIIYEINQPSERTIPVFS